jgi:DHA3 family multidrug efflux protein-like MFS transporter
MAKTKKQEPALDAAAQEKLKAFYHLLINSSFASILNYTVWFAITFFVYIQTQSVFATAIISGIYLIVTALTGIWFGSIVDHHRKKQVMLIASWGSLAAYFVALGLYMSLPFNTFGDVSNPWLWTFILVLMAGVMVNNIRNIALPTTVTLLVPSDRRDKANGLVGTAMGLGMLVTSVISGILVGLAGMLYVLILAIVGMLLVIFHLLRISVPEPKIVHVEGAPQKVDLKGTIAIIGKIPGMYALILFTTFNNLLGGVFMALMDAYGLSLMSVQAWGFLWGFLSTGFIVGGLLIAKKGLGKNPLRAMMLANIVIWVISSVFTLQASILLLTIGSFIYMAVMPYIEAAEQTVLQKVVPADRQGRVFGFAQSVEMAASPLMAFLIGPIAQFWAIPLMSDGGAGAAAVGAWFGTGANRGMALLFTAAGIIGLVVTLLAFSSKYYRRLSKAYLDHPEPVSPSAPVQSS